MIRGWSAPFAMLKVLFFAHTWKIKALLPQSAQTHLEHSSSVFVPEAAPENLNIYLTGHVERLETLNELL